MKITKNICIMKIFSSTVNAMREKKGSCSKGRAVLQTLLPHRRAAPLRRSAQLGTGDVTKHRAGACWGRRPGPGAAEPCGHAAPGGDAAPWGFQSRYTMVTPQQKGLQGGHSWGSPPPPFALLVQRTEGSGTRVGCGGAPKQGACSPDC